MGKFAEDERLPVEDEPCLEKRHIKSFPVIRDNGLKTHLGKKLAQLLNHPLFFAHLSEEVLRDIEFIISVVAHPNQKGHDTCSTRKSCCLKVDEQSRGKVQAFKLGVFAEPDKYISLYIQTCR